MCHGGGCLCCLVVLSAVVTVTREMMMELFMESSMTFSIPVTVLSVHYKDEWRHALMQLLVVVIAGCVCVLPAVPPPKATLST